MARQPHRRARLAHACRNPRSVDLDGAGERVIEAARRRVAYLEGLLLGATPRTRAGALAQPRRVAASMAEGTISRSEGRRLRLARATLARLSRADQGPHHPWRPRKGRQMLRACRQTPGR